MSDLWEMSPESYTKHFSLDFYFRDVLSIPRDGRSAEFLGRYFDMVLRGEHLMGRTFAFVSGTPANRRVFVGLFRQCMSGAVTSMTLHDFHDLVLRLCSDFPWAVVQDAGMYAPRVASTPCNPAVSSTPVSREREVRSTSRELVLYDRDSLQRVVEFCFVYAELLCIVKSFFETREEGQGGVFREELVREIEHRLRAGDLEHAASPTPQAVEAFLRSSRSAANDELLVVTLKQVVCEMADHFELVPDSRPDEDLVMTPRL